jgi:hypothetical protein
MLISVPSNAISLSIMSNNYGGNNQISENMHLSIGGLYQEVDIIGRSNFYHFSVGSDAGKCFFGGRI